MRRARRGVDEGFGEEGCNRGDDIGAIRGEPPMGRYFGVEGRTVGLRRGEDGNDRTPDPLLPDLLSNTDK